MQTVLGTLIHAPRRGAVEIIDAALVAIGDDGMILAVRRPGNAAYEAARHAARDGGTLRELKPGQYLLPGLVDLHLHAPQWPQLGKALDLPLERWLFDYTFPLEARFADIAFTQAVYASMVDTLLAYGTTTAMYFGTVHLEATLRLADICLAKGQRALVGRVAMDHPEHTPDFYRDASAQTGVDETRALITSIRAMPGNDGRVLPVITPRFIPACTDTMLEGLGRLAAETGCHVQTHCSESDWEHAHVRERMGMSDAQSLERFGLLTRRTVLAHGIMLDREDLSRIGKAGAAIAHCPLSNFYFGNAVLPLNEALAQGVRVGLGSDVAGGPSPFLLEACRSAITASRALEDGVDPARPPKSRGRPNARIDFRDAFWLATAGGGEALDLPVGRFEPGYQFDALVIDTAVPDTALRLWPDDTGDDVLQKIIYGATPANIREVWVAGRQVVDKG
jgi:guanine deaminase